MARWRCFFGKYLSAKPNGDVKVDCNHHVGDWESRRLYLKKMKACLLLSSHPSQFVRADLNGIGRMGHFEQSQCSHRTRS